MASSFTDFWQVSKQLCSFLEIPQNLSVTAYRKQLALSILDIYRVALTLPDINTNSTDELDDDHLEKQVGEYQLTFEDQMGDVDYYLECFDPFNFEENTLVNASLTEELREIYRRLKVQLLKIETGDDKWIKDAEWTIGFYLNLSLLNELIDVARAIHYSIRLED